MRKNETIVRYTAEEIDAMIARGEDRTDWERVNALTAEEIDRGEQLHAASTKFLRMWSPTCWLFSGWNWQANRLSLYSLPKASDS